jgi:hypothetical protein
MKVITRGAKGPQPLDRPMHGVVTEEEAEALRKRNEDRAKVAIERLGTAYVCHQPLRRQGNGIVVPASLQVAA